MLYFSNFPLFQRVYLFRIAMIDNIIILTSTS